MGGKRESTASEGPSDGPSVGLSDGRPSAQGGADGGPEGAGRNHLRVDEGCAGQRLDNFLFRHFRGMPKAQVYRWIRTGQVRVDGRRAAQDSRLETGAVLRLPPMAASALDEREATRDGGEHRARVQHASRHWRDRVAVVHEDEHLLVVDKPPGLAVHGGSGIQAGLIEQLRLWRPEARFLELGHRLDRDTSGVLMIAKSRRALLGLHDALAARRADKRYLAIVQGWWGQQEWKALTMPLERYLLADGERRVRVQAGGMPSETRVRVHRRFETTGIRGLPPAVSMLECRLMTGRTHQIRVHLAHAGHGILGDQKYGDFTLNKLLEKLGHKFMYLHAYSMRMEHPVSGEKLHLVSPVPAHFEALVAALGKAATGLEGSVE